MAEEIAKYKTLNVRRKNKDELLKIKNGFYDYNELVKKANDKIQYIDMLFQKSDLPQMPDKEYCNKLLFKIRERFYKK